LAYNQFSGCGGGFSAFLRPVQDLIEGALERAGRPARIGLRGAVVQGGRIAFGKASCKGTISRANGDTRLMPGPPSASTAAGADGSLPFT